MKKVHQGQRYPENWRRLTLDDCGKWIGGGTPLKSNPDYWMDGNVPWATSQDIIGPMLTSTTYKITEQAVKETTTNIIPKNSIVFVMRSGILRRKFPVTKTIGDVAINQDLRALIPNNNVDFEYLYNFMMHNEKKILETCVKVGTTVESVEFNFLKKFDIHLPPKEEQQKIASILSTWDKAIELKEKLIEQKKEQKKGLMQRLLTGEVRLPGFDGKWERKKIRDFSKVYRGASPRPISDPKWFDQDSSIGWVRISDVTSSLKYLNETEQYLSIEGVNKSRLIKKDNLIMSICATVGKPIITGFDVCIHDGFVVFDELMINKDYLYYVLLKLENQWSRHGQTGSQMNLNTEIVGNEEVSYPQSQVEQQAIVEVLTNADKEIDLITMQYEELKKQKKVLMQNLLTGKVRVRV